MRKTTLIFIILLYRNFILVKKHLKVSFYSDKLSIDYFIWSCALFSILQPVDAIYGMFNVWGTFITVIVERQEMYQDNIF